MRTARYRTALLCSALWLAGATALAPASAQATQARTQQAATVRAALSAGDPGQARRLFNRMVDAYLTEGAPRPDPELDHLLADIFIATGRSRQARPLLDQALAATPPGTTANALHLKRAQVREDLADFTGAECDYRLAIKGHASGTPEHRQATFGLARLLLADKPADAARLVIRELANKLPDSDWEGHLIHARAAAIAGDLTSAHDALQRAWAAAPNAPITARAAPRIANDMALLAGLAGDRDALTALLAISRANHQPIGFAIDAIRSGLPVCETNGLLPTDWVVIELISSVESGPAQARLAHASRPGIARPFLQALISNPAFDNGRIGGPTATMEMRCSTALQTDYNVIEDLPGVTGEWLLSKGAYPVMAETAHGQINMLRRYLELRKARFGPDSILLVPILLQQAIPTTMQSLGRTGPALRPLTSLLERADRIVNLSDAPAEIRLMSRAALMRARLLNEATTSDAFADEYRRLLSEAVSEPSVSLDMVYAMANLPQVPVEFRADLAEAALAAFEHRASPDDPRRRALVLHVAEREVRRGNMHAAATMRSKAGFPSDLCQFASPEITLVHQAISSYDDFPVGARWTRIPGSTVLEFDVSPSGETTNVRMILAEPPLLFNPIATTRARQFRYDPPQISGQSTACRGQSVNIHWRHPD